MARAIVINFPRDRVVEGRYDLINELNKTSMSVRLAKQDQFIEGLVELYSSRIMSKLEYHGFDVDSDVILFTRCKRSSSKSYATKKIRVDFVLTIIYNQIVN